MDRWVRQPEAWEAGATGCLSSEAADFAGQNKRGEKSNLTFYLEGEEYVFRYNFCFGKLNLSEFGSGGNNPNS